MSKIGLFIVALMAIGCSSTKPNTEIEKKSSKIKEDSVSVKKEIVVDTLSTKEQLIGYTFGLDIIATINTFGVDYDFENFKYAIDDELNKNKKRFTDSQLETVMYLFPKVAKDSNYNIDSIPDFDKKVGYILGTDIGRSLKRMGIIYDFNAFVQGLNDQYNKKENKLLAREQVINIKREIEKAMMQKQQKQQQKASTNRKIEGIKFLEENAKKDSVVVTASGLQYKVLKEGTGKINPKSTDEVTVHYEGKIIDGRIFDSSIQRGEPATFPLNRVIAGWTEGVQLMTEGAKYRFFIPYNLGYGVSGAGGLIGPYEALIFDVELIEIKK